MEASEVMSQPLHVNNFTLSHTDVRPYRMRIFLAAWGAALYKKLHVILRATPSAAGRFELLAVAISEAWCFHFGISGDHVGTSGVLWGTMGSAESDFLWFWDGLGPHLETFLVTQS